jgi:hypothetical protein
MLTSFLTNAVVLIIGILLGGFIFRRDPVSRAKTLDALEKAYADAKSKLTAKAHK